MNTGLKPGVVLEDQKKIKFIEHELARLWGIDKNAPFRGFFAKPVSLEKRHFQQLVKHSYTVSEKTDGVAFVLLTSRWPGFIDPRMSSFAVLVDSNERHFKMYEVAVYASPDYFQGSLFIAELIWENPENGTSNPLQTLMIYDVASFKGQDVTRDSYIQRYNRLLDVFLSSSSEAQKTESKAWQKRAEELGSEGWMICAGNEYGLSFVLKEVQKDAKALMQVWEKRATLRHQSDGLIFTPIHEPVGHGTQWTLFKYKQDHTLDFQFEGTRTIDEKFHWKLYFAQPSSTVPVQGTEASKAAKADLIEMLHSPFELNVNGNMEFQARLKVSKMLLTLLKKAMHLKTEKLNFIGECRVAINERILEISLERIRTEKTLPNWKYTVERTLVNIQENISVQELVQLFH